MAGVVRSGEQAVEAARAADALQAVTDALATAGGLDEIVPTVLRIAADTFGVAAAGFYDVTAQPLVRVRYWWHGGRVYSPDELLTLDPDGWGDTARRLAAGFTVSPDYLDGEPSSPRRTRTTLIDHAAGTVEPGFDEWACRHGWATELNVPCFTRGEARGAICLYRPAGHGFTAAEVALAESLAKQLALAVQADRLAAEARQAVAARERQAAAERRAAELATANEALRQSLERLSRGTGLDGLLEALLLEAVRAAGAAGGGITGWRGGRFDRLHCVAQDGRIVPPEVWGREAIFRQAAEVLARDAGGFATQLLSAPVSRVTVSELSAWWPAAAEYHARHGHTEVWNLPCAVRGELLAHLGLGFRQPWPTDEATVGTLAALARQVTLVLELTRRADADRAAAVARERQAAAESRAAELARRDRLLSAVARFSEALVSPDPAERAMQTAVEQLLDADGISRVYVGRNEQQPDGEWGTRFLCEAVRAGLPLQRETPGSHPVRFADHPDVVRTLRAGGVVNLSDFDGHPAAARGQQERVGAKANLMLPVFVRGDWWGVVGFDNCDEPRVWAAAEVDVLRGVAAGVTSALAREQAEAEARAAAVQVADERQAAAERRAAELAKASDVLRAVNARPAAETDVSAILGHVLAEACKVLGVIDGCLTLLGDDGHLRMAAAVYDGRPSTTLPGHPFGAGEPFRLDQFPGWGPMADLRGRPIVMALPDAAVLADATTAWHRDRGHAGVVLEALMLGDDPVGLIGLAYGGGRTFTPEQLGFLQALGQQAASAVRAARMAEAARASAVAREREAAAERRVAELKQANETLKRCADGTAAGGADPAAVLGRVLATLSEHLRPPSAALWIAADGRFDLHLAYLDGQVVPARPDTDARLAGHWGRGHGLIFRRHIDERRPVVYGPADLAGLPAGRAFFDRLGVRSLLGVPLVMGDAVIGCLTARFPDGRGFDRDDLELVQAVAHQATLALELTRLSDRARAAAVAGEREAAGGRLAAELQRANDALQRTVDTLSAVGAGEPFMPAVLRIAAAAFDTNHAAYYEHLDDEAARLRHWLRHGRVLDPADIAPDGTELMAVAAALARGFVVPPGYFGGPLRGRTRAVVVDHVAGTGNEQYDRLSVANGWGRELNVPLVVDGRADGALVVYRDAAYTPGEVCLAETLGKQLALAVQLDRLGDARRDAAVAGERNRLAGEVHDTLAQGFAGVLAQLAAADGSLTAHPEAARGHLTRARELARVSLAEARRSVHALRPLPLAARNLPAALAALGRRTAGPPVRATVAGPVRPLPAAVEGELYRVAQEAVANADRHAAARRIEVGLTFDPDRVLLTVRDDGRGFDPAAVPAGHGLVGMQGRMDRAGGTLTIVSEPGRGTEVVAVVPTANGGPT